MVGIPSALRFEVYLPSGYDEGKLHYPVLYSLPGWGGGNPLASKCKGPLDEAIQNGRITPTIAVFINIGGILFLNSSVFGNWGSFMVSELVPFIDRNYRTVQDWRARGLMGFSMGGYSALMLPILHPGVWGSIGENDPSTGIMWRYIRSPGDALSDLQKLPGDINAYPRYPGRPNYLEGGMMQLGAAFTPNLDAPLLCDFPITEKGEWVPEVREKWSEYDLSNLETLAKHSETLKALLCIAIVVPESSSGTNRNVNIDFIGRLETAGISVTRLDMPGGHGDFNGERFAALAEQILSAMEGAEVSVSPNGRAATLWGKIKQGW